MKSRINLSVVSQTLLWVAIILLSVWAIGAQADLDWVLDLFVGR